MSSKKKNVCTLILDAGFAQTSTDFARIFTKSNVLGVSLHALQPRLLHQWIRGKNLCLCLI